MHSATKRLTALWRRSIFDQDCKTLDDYAARVCERIKKATGQDVKPGEHEKILEIIRNPLAIEIESE